MLILFLGSSLYVYPKYSTSFLFLIFLISGWNGSSLLKLSK
jgi:hypothetical protein